MRLLLLDGHNLLYRAFTSLPSSITGRDGRPIHGAYGLMAAVLRLWRETSADSILAAFDEPDTPTFRHQLFPAYQGQRGPLGGDNAPEFRRQVDIARSVLPAAGIPVLSVPGYEADDVMATLAVQNAADGGEAIIVSTDRDLLQLVRPGVSVLVPGKANLVIADADGVRARIGVGPEGVTTFKALAGDASDNIPGVSGIGTKTAAALVDQFESLEGIYASLESLAPRVAGRLTAERDRAFLFREVVTVVSTLTLPLTPRDLAPPAFTPESRVRDLVDRA